MVCYKITMVKFYFLAFKQTWNELTNITNRSIGLWLNVPHTHYNTCLSDYDTCIIHACPVRFSLHCIFYNKWYFKNTKNLHSRQPLRSVMYTKLVCFSICMFLSTTNLLSYNYCIFLKTWKIYGLLLRYTE